MSIKRIIYPGTFDPITHGHRDIIERAAKLCDELIVAIAANEKKSPRFHLEKRIELAKKVLAHFNNVRVLGFNNLLIDFAKANNASVILRGLRTASDFEFEFQLASMNRKLAPNIDTIFLTPSDQYTAISSSLIREIASHGGDVSQFVDQVVVEALKSS